MKYLRAKRFFVRFLTPISVFALVIPLFVVGFPTNGQTLPDAPVDQDNSQTLALLSPFDQNSLIDAIGGGDIEVFDDTLVPQTGPQGTAADQIFTPTADQISLYVVQEGDTLGHIAELFDVSGNTIRWANDINSKSTIRPGQILSILPISSVQHVVEKNETLASIVKQYEGDLYETALFNGIEENAKLAVGETILIPDGVSGHDTASTKEVKPSTNKNPSTSQPSSAPRKDSQYFTRAWGGVVSQGFHGQYRAIDYALPTGSAIGAAAGGTVISARSPQAWNGGYGGMVVLRHNNGSQTLYAHLSQLKVGVGQTVKQGELVGLSGNTGRSTGPHLHFEIRGWGDVPAHMR